MARDALPVGYIEVDNLVVRYGDVTAVDGVSFAIAQGEHLTLLGPSGCGKTTTLRAIAGLETPISGEIRIDGRPVYSSSKRTNVPPEGRDLSMVFQSYAIWPHMTVAENVAYGLKLRKYSRDAREKRVGESLGMVQLGDFAERPASRLSGGQQQRVALARSFAFYPKALLLDEPLSNLDAKLRAQMRVELRELQKSLQVTSIYVTHDQEEALAISDRIIVMNGGKIEQMGTPTEIYDRPRTAFVADFVGASNILAGEIVGGNGNGHVSFQTGRATLTVPSPVGPGASAISVRTVYPDLTRRSPEDQTNTFPAIVARRVFLGDSVQYFLDWPGGELSVRKLPVDLLQEGESIFVRIAPEVCVFVE
ncbi:MAG: ABC transporter ATP-binding protein [Chloroflexota bacterium]